MNILNSRFFALISLSLILPGAAFSAPWLDTMPHDRYNNLTFSGDLLATALPGVAVLAHLHTEDSLEIHRAGLAVGGIFASTDVLKRLFNHTWLGERPNGYHSSFPSGHSSSAFLGARLIHRQFGIEYGAPAYALATLTAYSRVQGHYHHIHDVAAGAALAFAVDYLVDLGLGSDVLRPIASPTGRGIGLTAQIEF